MSFQFIKDNAAEFCVFLLGGWLVTLMALDLAWSGYQTAKTTFGADAQVTAPAGEARNERGCLEKDGIEICKVFDGGLK